MTRMPAADRAAALGALGAETFDLVVIGGGITGAGVARDAALRGLRVALVERDDWASGTSSRSSRLVHGGVRYLEHGHLRLVFEASRERRILLRTAPHLVRPLAFTWPVYRGARVPRWKLEAGLTLYDALSLWRNVAAHRPLSPAGVRAGEPALAAQGLTGGARYYDAATDDGRLTLATALAARDAGAAAVNHAAATALAFDRGGPARVRVRDALGGAEVEVRARAVVNATGPWSDAVRRLHLPDAPDAVLGAKGVHVAVPAERVGNRGAVTLLAPRDGRVTFVLPAGPHTVVGTTETPVERGPDDVRANEADVAYLLAVANHHFPDARLERADVVGAWAGVRPLAAAPRRGDAGGGTGRASREHAIDVDPRGVLTVTGGKLTTYRSTAAEVVDAACALLGTPRPRAATDRLPLEPGYDARRARVAELAASDPALAAPVAPGLPYVGAEFAYAVEAEQAATLADLLVRRAPVAYATRDAGRAAARVVAPLLARALGWDAGGVARALAPYDAEAARLFAVDA